MKAQHIKKIPTALLKELSNLIFTSPPGITSKLTGVLFRPDGTYKTYTYITNPNDEALWEVKYFNLYDLHDLESELYSRRKEEEESTRHTHHDGNEVRDECGEFLGLVDPYEGWEERIGDFYQIQGKELDL